MIWNAYIMEIVIVWEEYIVKAFRGAYSLIIAKIFSVMRNFSLRVKYIYCFAVHSAYNVGK